MTLDSVYTKNRTPSSAIATEDYLKSRAERANPDSFSEILARVPKRPALPEDTL